MTSSDIPQPASDSLTIGELAAQFLITLSPEERPNVQQEIYKFVYWYGEGYPLARIAVHEVANYAEQITLSTIGIDKKLDAVKSLLAYAHKQGLTKVNLATHLKAKKTSSRFLSSSKRNTPVTVQLTSQGYSDMETELATLKNERPRVAEELKKAAADKDFRENAPLEAMREYQGQMEARIRELESVLSSATIMTEKQIASREIAIGDTVMIRSLTSGEQIKYTLVNPREADPIKGKISVASPTGKALLGRKREEMVDVTAPAGVIHYQVVDILH